jgi:hypothetical protein
MIYQSQLKKSLWRQWKTAWALVAIASAAIFLSAPAFAQQMGGIAGQVTDAGGAGVEGVTIVASGNTLPQPRTTTSGANGNYRFRLLPPGSYSVQFTLPDGSTRTRTTEVLLQQVAEVNLSTAAEIVMEEVITTAAPMMADVGQGSLKNAINADTIDALPVGQQYRDLMKLIPGVQYTEDAVLGPSAGGSASDNTFQFDGVDVTLPLFGNLASEPSTHDIAQVSIVRGGAKAIGFNRSGGLTMNTLSKSGTNEFHGEISYQVETKDMRGDLDTGSNPQSFDEDRSWITASLGGPIIKDRLLFYASYYRPEFTRSNTENAYGDVPDFENSRDEYFGKLTWSPTDDFLLDVSHRTSEREVVNEGVGAFTQPSAADISISNQDISTIEGSWIISDASTLSFRWTDWENETGSDPAVFLNFDTALGDSLNVGALDQQGLFRVPTLISDPQTPEEVAFNAFAAPLIEQYGYLEGGTRMGGGLVGSGGLINSQDFFRESWEIAFDHIIETRTATHDIHIGYQHMEVSELLLRVSNGWGTITPIGGLETAFDNATPVYYRAAVRQQGLVSGSDTVSPPLYSVTEMDNIEINDAITIGDITYNIGFLFSNDKLYGQGLRENANNPSGYELAIGNRYLMKEVRWSDMIQPRLGINWDYSDDASAFVNFARYHPTASSLSRAASWDRNFADRIMDVNFDENGNFIDAEPQAGSGGKLFEADIKPRVVNEWLVGWTKDLSSELSVRAHARYRKGGHFWEDVPNDIYLHANPPPGIPREEVIPDLATKMADLGGGSIRSFVIDDLDGAFTKYYEASFEADWAHDNWFVRGSYVWSHYYGNFDNDNISGDNDRNLFIGSSSYGDGGGRMMWNNQEGNLRGDRRHQFKATAIYDFERMNASLGAYLVWQSGQPWTPWDDAPWADEIRSYRAATGRGTNTSSFLRFAEPAGSRETDEHYQLDLNYTHNFPVFGDHNVQLRVDLFNVTDNQTGYNIQTRVDLANYGNPRSFFRPRRFQVAVKYQF